MTTTPHLPPDESKQATAPTDPAGSPGPDAQDATRTAQILRLADEQAAALRAQATQDAEAIREEARREADAVRAHAQRDAADVRLAALAEAESVRQQALTESEERRADLEREADELVVSVWWLAERVRAAAGKDPRELPHIPDAAELAHDEATDDTTGDSAEEAAGVPAPVHASEETLARHSALRRAAVAAQRSRRTTDAAQEESERTLARARREAEELLNRARAEADQLVANAESEGERAVVLAQRRVETLNRERDGILTSLGELMQHTADLGLQQTSPTITRIGGADGIEG